MSPGPLPPNWRTWGHEELQHVQHEGEEPGGHDQPTVANARWLFSLQSTGSNPPMGNPIGDNGAKCLAYVSSPTIQYTGA